MNLFNVHSRSSSCSSNVPVTVQGGHDYCDDSFDDDFVDAFEMELGLVCGDDLDDFEFEEYLNIKKILTSLGGGSWR